jgi:hypothetical protein
VSGEWVNEFIPNNGRKKGGGKLYVPSTAELLKRNIRRSWTISSRKKLHSSSLFL